jgi:hypothetical protein
MLAVRWYLRYGLSYRDVAELLADAVLRWIRIDALNLPPLGRPRRDDATTGRGLDREEPRPMRKRPTRQIVPLKLLSTRGVVTADVCGLCGALVITAGAQRHAAAHRADRARP